MESLSAPFLFEQTTTFVLKAYAVPVAYVENFHGEVSFNGLWWSFLFGVLSL